MSVFGMVPNRMDGLRRNHLWARRRLGRHGKLLLPVPSAAAAPYFAPSIAVPVSVAVF